MVLVKSNLKGILSLTYLDLLLVITEIIQMLMKPQSHKVWSLTRS